MRRLTSITSVIAVAAMAALPGCGGDEERGPPPPSPEAVVRGWADDLRRGDVETASKRFAVPSLVSNGTPLVRLDTPAAVRSFNESLPCGGRITDTERRGSAIVATFVLTDRPGGDCGSGAGGTARAAFEVRDGRIVRWVRVGTPAPSGPTV